MTDRLKLSNANGDSKLDKLVIALQQKEHNKRIRKLEQNIAELEKLVEDKARPQTKSGPSPNNKIGARKDASFKAISTAPSINKTPLGPTMVPIPYPTVQDLAGSVNAASSVNFNGKPVYLLDKSKQSSCKGDEPGTGKGIRSGTVSGEVKPVKGSRTVRVEGKHVVREGDACTMNGGNNPGIYVTTQVPSSVPPKEAIKTSNPPVRQLASAQGTGKDIATNWDPANPLQLPKPSTPEEQVTAMMQKDLFDGSAAMRRNAAILTNKPVGPQLVARDAGAEAQQKLRTANTLNIALLGIFGGGGAAARLLGADETAVAGVNDIGGAAMGVAWSFTGMPGRQAISTGARAISKHNNAKAGPAGDGVKIVGTGKRVTNNSNLGKVLGEHSAVNPGPLSDEMAGTFAGGRYRVVELQKDTILYRGGTADQPLGQFFSTEAPAGVLQTRIDKAVLPVWPGGATSPIDTAFAVKIPKGTLVYVGDVGSQGGLFVGGSQQIVVVKPWTIKGVQVVGTNTLK
jgi:uncharacterized Zn-binding protein involved in type VI secretion